MCAGVPRTSANGPADVRQGRGSVGAEVPRDALAVERIRRELDVAVDQHRDPQPVAALERDATVDVDNLERCPTAEQRLELRRDVLAEVATRPAIENELAHDPPSVAAASGATCRARLGSATLARRAR